MVKIAEIPKWMYIVIIAIIVIGIISLYPEYSNDNEQDDDDRSMHYYGVEISLEYSDSPIYINDLSLNDSNLNNLTNETFSLIIEVELPSGNQSVVYPFMIVQSNNTCEIVQNYSIRYENYSYWTDMVFYSTNRTDEIYNFTIRWDINSTDAHIQNLSLLGTYNEIKGSFFVESSPYSSNASVDNKYLDICNVVNERWYSDIILPFNINIHIEPFLGGSS